MSFIVFIFIDIQLAAEKSHFNSRLFGDIKVGYTLVRAYRRPCDKCVKCQRSHDKGRGSAQYRSKSAKYCNDISQQRYLKRQQRRCHRTYYIAYLGSSRKAFLLTRTSHPAAYRSDYQKRIYGAYSPDQGYRSQHLGCTQPFQSVMLTLRQ